MSVRAEIELRTRKFAIRTIQFVDGFDHSRSADVVAYQLVKAASSIGANYREAGRASSPNDFIHKMSIVEKEAAETQYWFEICVESGIGESRKGQELLSECTEILAIVTAACRKAKANRALVSETDPPFEV